MNGVRQINEDVMENGRTIIVTNNNINKNNLFPGTLYINPLNGDIKYLKEKEGILDWECFNFRNIFKDSSMEDSLFLDNSINGVKLIDATLTDEKIQAGTITGRKIANNTITTINIKEIDANKIIDKSITTGKICEKSITSDLLDTNSVTSDKIMAGNIKEIHIDKDVINNEHIKDKIINADKKIMNKSITSVLISDNTIETSMIKKGQITCDTIANKTITADNIKDGEITEKLIAHFAIKDEHIDSLDGSKILDRSISAKKLALSSITAGILKDGCITISKLDDELRNLINDAVSIKTNIKVNDTEYFNTAYIKGNVLISSEDDSKLTLSINGDINASGDITGSRVFNPYFADIAEAYIPQERMMAGEPVCLSKYGKLYIEKLTLNNYNRFIGFVSDNYANIFGASKEELDSGKKIPVALVGRVNVKIPYKLKADIGDYLVLVNGKFASSSSRIAASHNCMTVGRFLENKTTDTCYALCQVFPV